MLPWHEDQSVRQELGDQAEKEFIDKFFCDCGGKFEERQSYGHDVKCSECGVPIEIKTDTRDNGRLPISQIPYDNYPDDRMICIRKDDGRWTGIRKEQTEIISGPHTPTHSSRPTNWYLIDISKEVPLR